MATAAERRRDSIERVEFEPVGQSAIDRRIAEVARVSSRALAITIVLASLYACEKLIGIAFLLHKGL